MSKCQVCLLELEFVYFEALSTIFHFGQAQAACAQTRFQKVADNDSHSALLLNSRKPMTVFKIELHNIEFESSLWPRILT